MNGYTEEKWQDHILNSNGTVAQQGTLFSSTRMINIENGIQANFIVNAVMAQYAGALKTPEV